MRATWVGPMDEVARARCFLRKVVFMTFTR